MLGMVAAPGTELFRLVRQNRLEWRAELTGAQLAQVHAGDEASVQLADRTVAHGRVRQVAPVIEENTRIGVAYVELDRGESANSAARAGMYGTGTITLGQRVALTLPSDAIVMRDGHEYVFVLGPDGRVALTKVDIGRRFGNGVEISGGVTDAQQVVAAGAAFLNDRARGAALYRHRHPEIKHEQRRQFRHLVDPSPIPPIVAVHRAHVRGSVSASST